MSDSPAVKTVKTKKPINPLKDGEGDWSSKRISSAICLLFTLSMPFWYLPILVAPILSNAAIATKFSPPSLGLLMGLGFSIAAAFQGISWGSEAAQAFARRVAGSGMYGWTGTASTSYPTQPQVSSYTSAAGSGVSTSEAGR